MSDYVLYVESIHEKSLKFDLNMVKNLLSHAQQRKAGLLVLSADTLQIQNRSMYFPDSSETTKTHWLDEYQGISQAYIAKFKELVEKAKQYNQSLCSVPVQYVLWSDIEKSAEAFKHYNDMSRRAFDSNDAFRSAVKDSVLGYFRQSEKFKSKKSEIDVSENSPFYTMGVNYVLQEIAGTLLLLNDLATFFTEIFNGGDVSCIREIVYKANLHAAFNYVFSVENIAVVTEMFGLKGFAPPEFVLLKELRVSSPGSSKKISAAAATDDNNKSSSDGRKTPPDGQKTPPPDEVVATIDNDGVVTIRGSTNSVVDTLKGLRGLGLFGGRGAQSTELQQEQLRSMFDSSLP